MIKIIFIVPDADQVEVVDRVYAEMEKSSRRAGGDNPDYSFNVCVAGNQRSLPGYAREADLIIGRGAIISDLKRIHPHISLVEIPICGEMASVLARARNEHPGERVAVLGASNMRIAAIGLDQALEMDVEFFLQEENEAHALRRDLNKILDAGFKVVVCGSVTYRYAMTRDCHPYRLEMSEDSVRHALAEATHWAVIRRQQRVKSAQLQAVLDSAHEGIIAADTGGRITVFNAHAAAILRTAPAKAIGSRIYDVLPMSQLPDDFRARDKYEGIVPLYGDYLSINKAPVFLGGELSGYVVTLQGGSAVRRIESEFRRKRCAMKQVARHSLDEVIGESPAIGEAIGKARAFAQSDSPVLLVGETGTGKGMFAEGIHNAGTRRHAPFVAVHCGMKPREALERKLFGSADGEDAPGGLEAADTGTLFLNHVGELPADLQGRLAQVLRDGMIPRPGCGRPSPIDVRIVASTERRLEDEVAAGRFDRDLFLRINVLTLVVPTLEQRGSDLLHLAAFFLDELSRVYRKRSVNLSEGACELLRSRRWPGNVRELRNVCECLVVLNREGVVDEDDIRRVFSESIPPVRG